MERSQGAPWRLGNVSLSSFVSFVGRLGPWRWPKPATPCNQAYLRCSSVKLPAPGAHLPPGLRLPSNCGTREELPALLLLPQPPLLPLPLRMARANLQRTGLPQIHRSAGGTASVIALGSERQSLLVSRVC